MGGTLMCTFRWLTAFAALAALGVAGGSARAEYPERQITLVACFPAGGGTDRKSTRLNSSHIQKSRMPSSA